MNMFAKNAQGQNRGRMENTKNVVFRSSMKGYNKSDVNNYLVKFNAEVTEREENAKAEIKAATQKAEKAEKDALEAQKKAEEYKERIIALEAEKDALAAQLQREQEENLRLEDEMQETIETKGETADDGEIAELRQKAALYDQNSANIGETLISAKKMAQEIIDSANKEANARDERSRAETEARKRALEESAKAASDSVFASLRLISEEGKCEVAAVREYAQTILEKALDDILGRMNQGTMKLEGMESTMLGKIQSGVSKVDNTPKRRASERKPTDFFKNLKPTKH